MVVFHTKGPSLHYYTHILIILAAIWFQRATSVKKWMRACFRTWRTFFGKGEIKAKIATLLAKLS